MVRKKVKGKFDWRFWMWQIIIAISVVSILIILIFVFLTKYTRHGEHFRMPDLYGMTVKEAAGRSGGLELRFDVFDSLYAPAYKRGAILEQYPIAGSVIKRNRKVIVTVNTFRPKSVEIPYVVGFSLRQAKNKLMASGLEIDKLIYKSDMATNNILAQMYDGEDAEESSMPTVYVDSKVDLVVGVSDNAPIPTVPVLIGLTLNQAKGVLWESGYNVGYIANSSDVNHVNRNSAIVVEQSNFVQTPLGYGSEISFRVSTDSLSIAESKEGFSNNVKNITDNLEKITNFKDTIQWIKEGREVVLKTDTSIFVYSELDTLILKNKIDTMLMVIDSISAVRLIENK